MPISEISCYICALFCLSERVIFMYIDSQKLNNERVRKGLSAFQLAEATGMSISRIDHLRRGVHSVNDMTAHKLCTALDVELEAITTTKDELLEKYSRICRRIRRDEENGLSFSVRHLQEQAEMLEKQIETMK